MSTRHDPAAAGTDPAAAGDAWLDVAPAGASAWDDQSDGDASAWAGSAEPAGSVWDADAPPPASAWDEDEPASVWDVGTDAPASARGRRAAGTAPERVGRAAGTAPERAGRAAGTAPERGRAASTAPAGAGAAEQSPEVAAVAARLAEIVARSGAGRVDAAATTAATHPAAASAATRAAASAAEAAAARGVPDTVADPDAEPVARRGATGPRDAGRRRTSGRRRAPATEPPGSGAATSDAEPDPESVARAIALRQLTAAPRSRAQLAEAMARRDVPEDVADRVLDRFTEVGLVDDAAYAEIHVRSRHAERGMSRRALAMELRRKGVDDEVAREALEQVDDADEEQAARALARKKLRATRGLDREVRLRRAYGALGRRGYGGSLVSRVVREELAAEGEDVRDD